MLSLIFAGLFTRPPILENAKIVSAKELRPLFVKFMADYLPENKTELPLYFTDSDYILLSKENMEKFIWKHDTITPASIRNFKPFNNQFQKPFFPTEPQKENWDCDDYAFALLHIVREAWAKSNFSDYPIPFGHASYKSTSYNHKTNIFIDNELKIWLYDENKGIIDPKTEIISFKLIEI